MHPFLPKFNSKKLRIRGKIVFLRGGFFRKRYEYKLFPRTRFRGTCALVIGWTFCLVEKLFVTSKLEPRCLVSNIFFKIFYFINCVIQTRFQTRIFVLFRSQCPFRGSIVYPKAYCCATWTRTLDRERAWVNMHWVVLNFVISGDIASPE